MHAVDAAMRQVNRIDDDTRDELMRHERRMQTLRQARATAVRQALEADAG